MDELREVTRRVVESAAHVQDVFQRAHPKVPRSAPRWTPRGCSPAGVRGTGGWERPPSTRTEPRRTRAAKWPGLPPGLPETPLPRLPAPIVRAHRVGHILRAAASTARIAELTAGDDPAAASRVIEDVTVRATPVLIDVLSRSPTPPAGRNHIEQLMSALDTSLRAHPDRDPA